ncbi:MAG: GHKL domain-containing protein [Bacteroidetes bacterium]|nr:MAG: GHKL domain-containing protein [Bacteroidota bacterium]TAE68923.1 MAG: GHKL domain-containing protein [Bacteroidota bacterium]TAF93437.1 MAG: GHKL domain-containing protein [Bacteroidota bacterium]
MKGKLTLLLLALVLLVACNQNNDQSGTASEEYIHLKQLLYDEFDSGKAIILAPGINAKKLGISEVEYGLLKANSANIAGSFAQAIDILRPLVEPKQLEQLPKILQADLHNQIGRAYADSNNIKVAVYHYQKLLALADELNDTTLKVKALNNIAAELTIANNPGESIKYLNQCVELATQAGLWKLKNDALTNLSYAWEKKNNFRKAIDCLLPVLAEEEPSNNPQILITTYDQLGYLYTETNKLDSANYFLQKAKRIADQSNNLTYFFWVYSSLANYYTKSGDYTSAIKYADTVLAVARKLNNHQARLDVYNTYNEIYTKQNLFKEALQYSNQAYDLFDSLTQVNQQNNVAALQKNYELNKADEQLTIERNNVTFNRIIASLLSLALLAAIVVILWAVRISNKRKQLIKIIDFERLKTEEALQENKKLIAFIAHEIRNPLTGIIGISKMLLNESITTEQKEFLTYQLNAGNNLLQLLSQLLDYQKVQSGKQELQLIPCSIKDVLKQVYEMYASLIQQKKITYKLQFDKSIPDTLHADPVKLTQVFGNLVNNAIKFCKSTQGEVTVTLTLIHSNSTLATILCSVRDNGAGISDADKEKIFDLYVQSSKNKSQQLGTGIGLSLVKHYLELMKSKIDIESTEGRGTTFSFTIALAK